MPRSRIFGCRRPRRGWSLPWAGSSGVSTAPAGQAAHSDDIPRGVQTDRLSSSLTELPTQRRWFSPPRTNFAAPPEPDLRTPWFIQSRRQLVTPLKRGKAWVVLWDSWNGERPLSSNKIERDDKDHFLLTEHLRPAEHKASGEMPPVDVNLTVGTGGR